MKIKLLSASALALPMAAGGAAAMDSDMIERHMEEISERTQAASEQARVEALETEVEELKELIRMMLEEEDAS